MKKISFLIIIFLFPIFVFAKEYEVKDVDVKLSIDDDWYVFTRENLDDNNDLENFGVTKEYLTNLMNNNNIYIDAIPHGGGLEFFLVIPKKDMETNDMDSYSDNALEPTIASFKEKFNTDKCSIYKSKHKYIRVDYYDSNLKYYIINYYTIVDGKGYNFQLQKKSPINEEEMANLQKTIDTIEIGKVEEKNNTSNETSTTKGFDYKKILTKGVIGAVVGAIIGGLSVLITLIVKKKKSS